MSEIMDVLARQILEGKFAAKDVISVEYHERAMHFSKGREKATREQAA